MEEVGRLAKSSGCERTVRLPVIEDVTESIHGVLEDRGAGEDCQAGDEPWNGSAKVSAMPEILSTRELTMRILESIAQERFQ